MTEIFTDHDSYIVDETELAEVIYEAKKKDAWGNWKSEHRLAWPSDKKELRTRRHHGEPALDFAFAQARAVIKYLKDRK